MTAPARAAIASPNAAGLGRIGGHGVEMPDAAGRQHDRARRNGHRPGGGVADFAQLQPGDRAVLGQQRFGGVAFDHPDRGRVRDGFDQRRHDRLAGQVAVDMDDAPRRMRGLAADREPAFEVAVERDAVVQEVVDAGAGFARDPQRERLIDQAGAGGDRIGAHAPPALSPSATAAAMPPCAHAVEAPWPSGAAEITVTGRGASFSAQNSPARPPPTMTTSSVLRVRSSCWTNISASTSWSSR